jgi:4-hydroxybenzoate polyprenyltransferase
VLTVVLMAAAILAALLPGAGLAKLVVALTAPWAMGWHLLWQIRRLDIDDPALCLRLFRANRDTGLIVALFLAAAAFL